MEHGTGWVVLVMTQPDFLPPTTHKEGAYKQIYVWLNVYFIMGPSLGFGVFRVPTHHTQGRCLYTLKFDAKSALQTELRS